MNPIIYTGKLLNPITEDQSEYFSDGALAVSDDKIIFKGYRNDAVSIFPSAEIIDFPKCVIVPGLIDLHTHLPQLGAVGIGKGKLLDWLDNYIFPLEMKFSDKAYAFKTAELFFNKLLLHGTTTAVCFASSGKSGACEAFKAAQKIGYRAYIGNALMDCGAPGELCYSPEKNIADALEIANCWHGSNGGKLNYILSPRYALACSERLLKMTADIAKTDGFFIQTHLAENHSEAEAVLKKFPSAKSYTDYYLKTGILNDKTILAHCIHLSDNEISIIHDNGSAIAHCPVSNRFLISGVMPFVKYRKTDIPIGFGTDIAAGYSFSLLHEARESVENSKVLSHFSGSLETISPSTAFYTATLGAAKILSEEQTLGSLEIGKFADFAIFRLPTELLDGTFQDIGETVLSKLLYCSNLEATAVYVSGEKKLLLY